MQPRLKLENYMQMKQASYKGRNILSAITRYLGVVRLLQWVWTLIWVCYDLIQIQIVTPGVPA